MAVGIVTKYNTLESVLFSASGRQWDDATVGSNMFILATSLYNPVASVHTTTADLGTTIITVGDGSPINVLNPLLDHTTVPGSTLFKSDSANFGAAVTITAKYLICVQPVVAGTFSGTTDKLLWYVDLDTTTTNSEKSSTAAEFLVNAPANGWYETT